MFKQYQVIKIIRDLNSSIKEGMQGVILETFNNDHYEVEFLDENGINFSFDNQFTFILAGKDLKSIEL